MQRRAVPLYYFIFSFRNLYQQQKLLSVAVDEAVIVGNERKTLDIGAQEIKEPIGLPNEPHYSDRHSVHNSMDGAGVYPVLAFVGTGLVLLFLLNQYYKGRAKPKKKRPRLKKLHHLVYGNKMPGV